MTKDEEIDAVLEQHNDVLCDSDRAVLELRDAEKSYPWRTIRSKVSGARLYIEMDGKWQEPEYALPLEAILATYPQLTEEKLFQYEEDMGL